MKDVWSGLEALNSGSGYIEKTPSMDAWPIWNYIVGQSVRVVCYTNAAKARLELNNKIVGKQKIMMIIRELSIGIFLLSLVDWR